MREISDCLGCGVDATLNAIGDTLLLPQPEEALVPEELLALTEVVCEQKASALSMYVVHFTLAFGQILIASLLALVAFSNLTYLVT